MGQGGQTRRGGRYGLLLVTLIVAYLISALATGRLSRVLQVVLFLAVTILALRTTWLPHHTRMLARWVALAGSVIMVAVAAASGSPAARGAVGIWIGLMLMVTVVIIVDRVLRLDTVTLQSIYGALSAYLIIGLMFSAFFNAINSLSGADFFTNGEPANTQTFQYFSFVTLTTLGYGDFTAAESFGRAVAVLEALTGQIFLATLVARLVSAWRPSVKRDSSQDDSPGGAPRAPAQGEAGGYRQADNDSGLDDSGGRDGPADRRTPQAPPH
jgi:voltage-gated potassium channel Kch